MILETPTLRPAAVPDEMPVRPLASVAPRLVRSYTRRVGLPELAARRATPREFKSQDGYILQKRSGPWKRICTEFLPFGFVVSLDGRSAALDVILPDGNTVTLPAVALVEDGGEHLAQWGAFHLLEILEVRGTGFWLRSVIPSLRDVRVDAGLRYREDEERASLRLIHVAEKALGCSLRGVHEP